MILRRPPRLRLIAFLERSCILQSSQPSWLRNSNWSTSNKFLKACKKFLKIKMHVYFSFQRLDRWKLNYWIWLASEWFWKWQTIKKLGEVLEKASLVAGTQKEAYRTKGTKCKPRKLSYSWLYPSRSANSHYSFWRSNALAFPRVQLFRKEIIMVKRKCIVNLRHYHWQRPVWVPKQCNLKEVELCQAHCDTSKQASKQASKFPKLPWLYLWIGARFQQIFKAEVVHPFVSYTILYTHFLEDLC